MTKPRKSEPADMTPLDFDDGYIVKDTLANRREARKLVAEGYEVCTLHPSWWSCVMPWARRRVAPGSKIESNFRHGMNYLLILPPRNFRAEEGLPIHTGFKLTSDWDVVTGRSG